MRSVIGSVIRYVVRAASLMLMALPLQGQNVGTLMHQADSAFTAKDRARARQLYRRVFAKDPDQSRAAYRLGLLAANDEEALAWFKRYAALERDDAWGWVAVGERSLRVGRTVEAREAYQRAATLEPTDDDIRQRFAKARLRAAPAVEPQFGYARDSDDGTTSKFGASGDVALRGGWRVGARLSRSTISDGFVDATLSESMLRLEGRPRAAWRIDLAGGAANLTSPSDSSWPTFLADARARWRSGGAAAEVRVRRFALGTSPALMAGHAVQNEVRVGVEMPAGPFRIRAAERMGIIDVATESGNRRTQTDLALVVPRGWRGEISAQYHRTGYERASAAGYFAPGLVESIEGGTYWDLGGDGAVSASVDLGAGAQRLVLQGTAAGPWKPALRGWAALSVDLSRTVQWRAEAEAYSAPFAPVGAATSADWRYGSFTTGLQLRLP